MKYFFILQFRLLSLGTIQLLSNILYLYDRNMRLILPTIFSPFFPFFPLFFNFDKGGYLYFSCPLLEQALPHCSCHHISIFQSVEDLFGFHNQPLHSKNVIQIYHITKQTLWWYYRKKLPSLAWGATDFIPL